MTTEERIERLCCEKIRSLKNATRLWNWIDHQDEPEPLWCIMTGLVSWAFDDPNDPNTVRFTY